MYKKMLEVTYTLKSIDILFEKTDRRRRRPKVVSRAAVDFVRQLNLKDGFFHDFGPNSLNLRIYPHIFRFLFCFFKISIEFIQQKS